MCEAGDVFCRHVESHQRAEFQIGRRQFWKPLTQVAEEIFMDQIEIILEYLPELPFVDIGVDRFYEIVDLM